MAGTLALVLVAGMTSPAFAQQSDLSVGQNAGSPEVAISSVYSGVNQCATIRSWDGATQRGGDLAVGGANNLQYGDLKTLLTNNGVGILPGVAGGSLSAATLAGVDVFYWGTSSHVLTGAEATALNNFIQNGGWLILETDSSTSEQTSANSGYTALGLGNRVGAIGSAANGIFENVVTATTVGPLGDFRLASYSSSLARTLDDTGHTLVGENGGVTKSIVEYTVGSGGVLGLGDPYGFNLFSADNNDEAITNYVLGNHCSVVIGGEIIPINTTALLLAGVQSISMWMIPVVLSGAGIGVFVIMRSRK